MDSTGGRSAVRNPPFCRIFRFFLRDVFLTDNALKSFFLRRKFVFCRSESGTFPFITFLAHSLTQSKNSLLHFRTYSFLPYPPFYVFALTWVETFSFADSFRHIHVLSLSGKYVRAQTQVLVLLRLKVHKQITIRFTRRVLICFNSKLREPGIHLPREMSKLTHVSRIFKQNHVVCIQTYGSRKLVFWKQILGEEHDTHVSVVWTPGEQVCNWLVRFIH